MFRLHFIDGNSKQLSETIPPDCEIPPGSWLTYSGLVHQVPEVAQQYTSYRVELEGARGVALHSFQAGTYQIEATGFSARAIYNVVDQLHQILGGAIVDFSHKSIIRYLPEGS